MAADVARAALRGHLGESAREAVRELGHYLERAMDDLPPSDQVPSINWQAPRGAQSDEYRELEMGLDELIRLHEQLAEEACTRDAAPLTEGIAWDLAFRLAHMRYAVADLGWAHHLGFRLFLAWENVVKLGARHNVCALGVNADFWDLQNENELVKEVAGWMGACARQGLLAVGGQIDHLAVSECISLTRQILPAMPDAAGGLTKGLDDTVAAVRLRSDVGDQDAKLILRTLEDGLSRIRGEAGPFAEDFNRGYRGGSSPP